VLLCFLGIAVPALALYVYLLPHYAIDLQGNSTLSACVP
jgi:hypothetical protein